jgi:V/A-type H+-transporting ATPase subunit G/H
MLSQRVYHNTTWATGGFSLFIIIIAYFSPVIKRFKNEAVHLMTAIYQYDAIQGNCMSKAEILTQLKTAEEQARARRAKADEEAKQTIAIARKDASAILDNARVKAAAEAQAKIDKAAAEIGAESKAMRAEGEKSAATLRSSAAKNVGAATNYLIAEFERYVDVRASKNG